MPDFHARFVKENDTMRHKPFTAFARIANKATSRFASAVLIALIAPVAFLMVGCIVATAWCMRQPASPFFASRKRRNANA